MNCLEYALLFWSKHPEYKIYYNSDHCINSNKEVTGGFLPLVSFGLDHIHKSFSNLLTKEAVDLLYKYFKEEKHDMYTHEFPYDRLDLMSSVFISLDNIVEALEYIQNKNKTEEVAKVIKGIKKSISAGYKMSVK